jgi:hypothetical protein
MRESKKVVYLHLGIAQQVARLNASKVVKSVVNAGATASHRCASDASVESHVQTQHVKLGHRCSRCYDTQLRGVFESYHTGQSFPDV